jgi:hypothetical protein
MIYSKKQIELFCRVLRGDQQARRLLAAEAKEFIALDGALLGEKQPTEWLLKNCPLLAVFCDLVVNGNNSAVKVLMAKKEFGLAAAANMYKGDDKAEAWLRKHNLEYYVELAESIKYAMDNRKKGGDIFSLFGM